MPDATPPAVHIRTPFYTVYDCPEWSLPAAPAESAAPSPTRSRSFPAAVSAAAGSVKGAMQRLLHATSNATSPPKPPGATNFRSDRNWTTGGDPVLRYDCHLSAVLACPPKHPRAAAGAAIPVRVDSGLGKAAEKRADLFRAVSSSAHEFERRGHAAPTSLVSPPDGGYSDPFPPALAESPDHHFVFCVTDFLSAAECSWLVAECKPLLAPVSTQYAQRTRECDRALFRSPRLARDLFARLAPHLTPRETEGRVPLCFGQGGVWRPAGVNPVFKVMRYPEGGQFADHRDGPWIPREDQASVFTVLVYLTEDFSGGHTTFFGPCSPSPLIRSTALGNAPAVNVVPVRGMAAVFNHDNVHCGNSVLAGSEAKTVLRFEVIFERAVPSVDVLTARFGHQQLEAYTTAAAKYASAHARVAAGDREGFMREYQEVVALQAEASRAELAATVGRAAPAGCRVLPRVPGDEAVADEADEGSAASRGAEVLNAEAFGEVLLFASDAEVVAVMCASRRAYYAVHTAPSWRERCAHHLPAGVHRAVEAQVPRGLRSHVPWVALYPRLRVLHRRFQPVSLLPLPTGVLTSFVSGAPPERALYRGVREHANAVRRRHRNTTLHLSPSVAAAVDEALPPTAYPTRTVEHFELASVFVRYPFDNPYHLNIPNVDRYRLQFAVKRQFLNPSLSRSSGNPHLDGSIADVTGAGGRTEWSVLVAAFATLYDPTWVPAIVVDAPSWTDVAAMRARTRQDLFECVRFHAVGHASIAECVAAKHAAVEGVPIDEVAVVCVVRFGCDAQGTVLRYAASSTSRPGEVFKIVFDDIENSATVKALVGELVGARRSGSAPSAQLYFVDLGPVTPVAPPLDPSHVAPQFPPMDVAGDDVVAAVAGIAQQLWPSVLPQFASASFIMDGSMLIGMRPEFRASCSWRVAW